MRKVDFSAQQHTGADHVLSFFQRLRLDWLLRHFPPRLVGSVYVFVNGFVTIAVLALLALVSRNRLFFHRSAPLHISCSSPLSARPQVHETLSWDMLLVLFAATGHSWLQEREPCRLEHIQEFFGRESYRRLSRSRLQEHSWFCSMLAIRQQVPPH
jgi:hypothetical protein